MGSSGDNSLGAVIFVGVAAGLVIICVWKIMWGRLPDDDDDDDQASNSSGGGGGGGGDRSVDDSGHISFATSTEDGSEGHIAMSRSESGHISFADDDEESAGGGQGQGHVPVSIISIDHVGDNYDHVCMSRSSSSNSSSEVYCIGNIFATGAAMDYQLSPRHYRAPV